MLENISQIECDDGMLNLLKLQYAISLNFIGALYAVHSPVIFSEKY